MLGDRFNIAQPEPPPKPVPIRITSDNSHDTFSMRMYRKLSKVWSWLDPVAHFILRSIMWIAPRVGRFMFWVISVNTTEKLSNGVRIFNSKRAAINVIKWGVLIFFTPLLLAILWYYSTWETYRNVTIPPGGVFLNEQFVVASKAGEVIAPRDEIFTVLGDWYDDHGEYEPLRFDLDFNMFFFWIGELWRPDLMSGRMLPRTGNGARCDIEVTSSYKRLPRFIRIKMLQWIDLRPEIVRVLKCEQLTADDLADVKREKKHE